MHSKFMHLKEGAIFDKIIFSINMCNYSILLYEQSSQLKGRLIVKYDLLSIFDSYVKFTTLVMSLFNSQKFET